MFGRRGFGVVTSELRLVIADLARRVGVSFNNDKPSVFLTGFNTRHEDLKNRPYETANEAQDIQIIFVSLKEYFLT